MFRSWFAIVPVMVSQSFGQVIIHVPTDAPTIQIAIQQAQPFDTIIVAPNTYFEAINFQGKVIALQSENPNDPQTVADTIIDAGGLGTVVTFAGTEGDLHTTLNGFTIIGGTTGIDGHGTMVTIQNCVIRDNSSYGVYRVHGSISSCVIRDNEGAGLVDCDGTIKLCTVDNNKGSGMNDCDGLISDCRITNMRGSNAGLAECNGRIERCVISNNNYFGLYRCDAYIKQSIISGSHNDGLHQCHGSTIENSIVAGNKGDGFESCSVDVLNCTVTGNKNYGFRSHSGSIKHAIIWANMDGALYSSTTPILSGTSNPFFVQPGHWDSINDVWIDGDYHLTADSPYIDTGDPFYGDDPNDPEEDLDGRPRVVDGNGDEVAVVDIGAYEFQAPCEGPDFDEDGTPDICDRDIDDDGVSNTLDACDFTPVGVPVDSDGRPHADLNLDCEVNLRDYAVFQLSLR